MNEINAEIKYLLKETGYEKYEELSEVDAEHEDFLFDDEKFMLNEYSKIMQSLEKASADISYLDAAISEEYILQKNKYGRYETPEHEYSCGNTIEFKYYDDFDERDKWAVSTIEHNGEDYYIVGYRSVQLERLIVRHRKFR